MEDKLITLENLDAFLNNVIVDSSVASRRTWSSQKLSTQLSTLVADKANKVDYTVSVDSITHVPDFSSLDGVTTDGIYNLKFTSVASSVETLYSTGVLIVTMGQMQQIFYYESPQIKSVIRINMGGTWMNMQSGIIPNIDDGTTAQSATTDCTYSRSKIDSLISALDTRISTLENA